MQRKRRRQPPSLDGVQIKLDRAKLHLKCFDDASRVVVKPDAYTFTVKIGTNGIKHVYITDTGPIPDPAWGAIIGDCAHNIRTALDHIAYQLVRSPNKKTQFPILDRQPWSRRWFEFWNPRTDCHISPGVPIAKCGRSLMRYSRTTDGIFGEDLTFSETWTTSTSIEDSSSWQRALVGTSRR